MQRLGQHFLKDRTLPKKIVDVLATGKGETVIEIGPGHGELTNALLAAAERADAKIICIERDRALVPALAALADGSSGRLTIIEADVLKKLPEVVGEIVNGNSALNGKGAGTAYRIVGNIPYYISGKLLRTIGDLAVKPVASVLMMQEEVVRRICAQAPDMNRLAASVQFWAGPEIVALVPRRDFSPPPNVDSAVVALFTKSGRPPVPEALYYRAVRAIFAQPGKTVLNNAAAGALKTLKKEKIAVEIKNLGIAPGSRPHDLTIAQIVALATIDMWG